MHLEWLTTQASFPEYDVKLVKGVQYNFEFIALQKSCFMPCHVSLKTGDYRNSLECSKQTA